MADRLRRHHRERPSSASPWVAPAATTTSTTRSRRQTTSRCRRSSPPATGPTRRRFASPASRRSTGCSPRPRFPRRYWTTLAAPSSRTDEAGFRLFHRKEPLDRQPAAPGRGGQASRDSESRNSRRPARRRPKTEHRYGAARRSVGRPWRRGSSSPDNPLVARVLVNRVWGWHFGRGIVAHAQRLRRSGRGPNPPRAARLAGRGPDRPWLETQTAAPADPARPAPTGWQAWPRGRVCETTRTIHFSGTSPATGSKGRRPGRDARLLRGAQPHAHSARRWSHRWARTS